MTRTECNIVYNEMIDERRGLRAYVRRVGCGNDRVYTSIDVMMARQDQQRLPLPPCTCPPMVEPWEMI